MTTITQRGEKMIDKEELVRDLTKSGIYADALEKIHCVQASAYHVPDLGRGLERLNNPQDSPSDGDTYSPYFHLR